MIERHAFNAEVTAELPLFNGTIIACGEKPGPFDTGNNGVDCGLMGIQ